MILAVVFLCILSLEIPPAFPQRTPLQIFLRIQKILNKYFQGISVDVPLLNFREIFQTPLGFFKKILLVLY